VLKFANVAISALDVSIRAQMMNLLKQIQTQDKGADLLVAHDLATVRHMTDQTIIRYLGKIVELAPTRVLFDEVRHPYTKALFCAVLLARSAQLAEERVLAEEVPSPLNPPADCRFDTPWLSHGNAALLEGGTSLAGSVAGSPRGMSVRSDRRKPPTGRR
jgi:ABC-type oligopeptide transport system ATPase subunit